MSEYIEENMQHKIFKVSFINDLMNQLSKETISFSRMVEILNEEVGNYNSGVPPIKLAKTDVVRYLKAYQKEFKMSKELDKSLNQTIDLINKSIVNDFEQVLLKENLLLDKDEEGEGAIDSCRCSGRMEVEVVKNVVWCRKCRKKFFPR